jgi:hypothetical protein
MSRPDGISLEQCASLAEALDGRSAKKPVAVIDLESGRSKKVVSKLC